MTQPPRFYVGRIGGRAEPTHILAEGAGLKRVRMGWPKVARSD
jgi:hypothetical protein